jgi:hypothetical protein
MMVMIVVVIAMCSLALARPDGAGQCYLYDNLNGNGFVGMADRPRNGTNTVTVEPSTAKAGDRVTITVQVSGGDEIVGILGTVYEIVNAGGVGVIQDGKHTPGEGMKLCEDRGPVDYAVTHAAPFVGKTSIAWNYTLWATAGQAGGMLQVRVVTLNGKKGDVASQKFALGFATIAVFGRSTMPGTVQTMVSGAPQRRQVQPICECPIWHEHEHHAWYN